MAAGGVDVVAAGLADGGDEPPVHDDALEGGDALIPLLDELVQGAGASGVSDVVLGMAHRGRLNVLVNLLGNAAKYGEPDGEARVTVDSSGIADAGEACLAARRRSCQGSALRF